MKKKRLWNLWKTITLLVCTVVIFSLLVTDILISHNVERTTEDSQSEKAKTIAHIVANDSIVIDGLVGKQIPLQSKRIQIEYYKTQVFNLL